MHTFFPPIETLLNIYHHFISKFPPFSYWLLMRNWGIFLFRLENTIFFLSLAHSVTAAAAAAKSLQSCPTLCDPIDGGPLSLGFSRQEYWSGLLFPSPMHESEKRK